MILSMELFGFFGEMSFQRVAMRTLLGVAGEVMFPIDSQHVANRLPIRQQPGFVTP
jgi:hypothetical protein